MEELNPQLRNGKIPLHSLKFCLLSFSTEIIVTE